MAENDVEINNAIEEINEIIEKCNHCGLCKELDPIFRVLRQEELSPRGKAILFSEKIFDKSVFDDCLCGLCKVSCPFKINMDEAIRKARKIMNLRGSENLKNKEMLAKILEKKNPYL